MVYKENFVVVVKVDGKILREQDGTVTLPFGSEYSLLLKNLNSRRVSVKISVDSKDVLGGKQLIIEPNTEYPLEGFLKGYGVKNKFKFIHKTNEIVKHRGDRIDDGMIRVEYTFEMAVEYRKIIHEVYETRQYPVGCSYYCYPQPPYWYGPSTYGIVNSSHSSGRSFTGEASSNIFTNSVSSDNHISSDDNTKTKINPDEGITVPGGYSGQTFVSGWIGQLEDRSHVIILKLRGAGSSGVEVSKPITVKTKLTCPTCGKKSKSHVKFCSSCGTSLAV